MNNRDTAVIVFGLKPFRIGSAEAFARELASQLAMCGWQCVLCFAGDPPEEVRHFLELPNVTIERIEESERLAWRPTKELAGILRKHRPRILHLNYVGMIGPYPWVARLLGVEKVYLTDQGSRAAGYVPHRARAWKRVVSGLLNGPTTAVTCVSRFGYECLADLGLFAKSRLKLIYNAVDVPRATDGLKSAAEFRRMHGIPPERPLVVQVSWMIPEKGIEDLLQAAKRVLAVEPDTHFLLAGDGAHRQDYERQARESGIGDRVTFTGVIQDPLAEGLFAAADVVCQFSRWEEVFGYVNAEAMASGKPVVATRVGGIPELVEDGVSGFLVERGDVAAMSARIIQLLRDPELRRRMGEAGLHSAWEKFNLRTNVAQLLELYGLTKPVMAERAPSAARAGASLADRFAPQPKPENGRLVSSSLAVSRRPYGTR